MKPYHLLLVCALLLIAACSKLYPPEGNFKAKLLASFCAFHIVQIEDADGKGRGMDWTDPSGKEYKNVFTVKNHCDFGKTGIKVGDTFKAVIIDKPVETNCAVCMGFMETPPFQWNIRVVE
ncbi:hypothetical protein [Lacibacter sediminis]|uniref:Uncharacterized protein n=1 Tax=Lacibacter sediminis TaxID=2760713 RepID=A0A7G5XJT3_9BACT|nr:hypothetical protein [Lacibacter sediminis]QNA45736.1 hypothetical protein H4075_05940 [Lacibacter sediminis]